MAEVGRPRLFRNTVPDAVFEPGQDDIPAVPVDIGVRTVVLGVPLGKARASPVKELSRQFPIQIIQDEHP